MLANRLAPLLSAALALTACQELPATPAGGIPGGADGGVCNPNACCFALASGDKPDECPGEACVLASEAHAAVQSDSAYAARRTCASSPGIDTLSYLSSEDNLRIEFTSQDCSQPLDLAKLRASVRSVRVGFGASEAQSGGTMTVTLEGGAEALDALTIAGGRLRAAISAPARALGTVSSLSCTGSHTLPVAFCNCRYSGRGPTLTASFDVPFAGP